MPRHRHSRISASGWYRTQDSTEGNANGGDIFNANARPTRSPSRFENVRRPDQVDFEPFFNGLLGDKYATHSLATGVPAEQCGHRSSRQPGELSIGQGQRVRKDDGGAVTLFAYDEAGQLIGEYDGSGNPIRETVWFQGAPVAVLIGSSLYYVHTDHLGTPRVITDGNAVVWRWESDPFGTTAAQEDPDGDGVDFIYNLRFPGQYYDGETGVHYNYFRTYDPSTGRYLEPDPIGLRGGLNTYGYVGTNPLSYADPFGLFEVVGDTTPGQRSLLEELGEALEKGLVDICERDRAEMQSIFDDLRVSVDPNIDDPLRRDRDSAADADFESRTIQFNYWFFNSSSSSQSHTFVHEFRHLMLINHNMIKPEHLTDWLLAPINPEAYRKLPFEVDADNFSRMFNADVCGCDPK